MRSDIDTLNQIRWTYCVLDEGHLHKNPKTATAKAARRLCSHHRLILSGTPMQNQVHELWSVFDFLMLYFLGTEADFTGHFARDLTKGHLPGASAREIRAGTEKLKLLHQQVLPFVLR